ncbi:MAG: response regulator [Candidatus Latescibacteria bacterium]|nr:response regulator [Candidatus Latescibacterota bacterium]
MNILLVDDDISSVAALTNLLEHDHTLNIASNGIDAFELFASGQYNVVITDIMMPKMNGVELLKAIRDKDKTIYVIMITGYPNSQNIRAAERYHAFALLTKPLDVERFMKVLSQIETEIGIAL